MTDHPDAPPSEVAARQCHDHYGCVHVQEERLRALVRDVRREREEELEHAQWIGTACLMLAEGNDPGWTPADNAWGLPAYLAVQRLRAEREALSAQVEGLTREKEAAMERNTLQAEIIEACPDCMSKCLVPDDEFDGTAHRLRVERDALHAELARQKQYAHDYISRTDPLLSCGYHEADAGTPGEPCGTCRMCALEERHALRTALLALHPEDCGTPTCKARVVLGQGAPPAEAQCVYLPQSGLVSQMLEPDWPCRRCGQEFKEHVAFTALGHESEPPAEAPEK